MALLDGGLSSLQSLSAYAGTTWHEFDSPDVNLKEIQDALYAKALAEVRSPVGEAREAIRASLVDYTPSARTKLIAAYDSLTEVLRGIEDQS
jgi:hypothetical protein